MFSKRQLGMTVYIKLVMIMELVLYGPLLQHHHNNTHHHIKYELYQSYEWKTPCMTEYKKRHIHTHITQNKNRRCEEQLTAEVFKNM
jgi:hypothetical protein